MQICLRSSLPIYLMSHSSRFKNGELHIAFNPSPFKEDIKLLPLRCVKWFFCNETEG